MAINSSHVTDQLNVLESVGICKWQHGSNGRFVITPIGGNETILTKREAWLWASGAHTALAAVRRLPADLVERRIENADHADKLYRINDALRSLSSDLGAHDSFETEEEYDAALDTAAHTIADLFRVREMT